uniref:Uncharacterized protein n=1 Tax=Anopheles epiroticus TaxID=199890 RepID=A0A182NZQ6_9DIPT
MGFIMPLYTIGIVSFFIYTIMKLIFKKTPATPYTEVKPDPAFRNEVFTTEQYIKRPDDGTTKLDQSHATAATNGELVVPVSVSPVGNAVPVAEPSTVQSELTIDYEQLSKQKEAAQSEENVVAEQIATVQAEASAVETIEHVETSEPTATVPPEECMEDVSAELQPPHDPTTEKVVDGIVVKKVVPVEESDDPSSRPVVHGIEEQGLTVDNSIATAVDDGVIDAVEPRLNGHVESEVIDEPVIEEVMVVQQVSVQEATLTPNKEEQETTVEPIDEVVAAAEPAPVTETKQNDETLRMEEHEEKTEQIEKLVEPITETTEQENAEELAVGSDAPVFETNDEKPVVQENEMQVLEEHHEDTVTLTSSVLSEHKASETDNTISDSISTDNNEESIDVPIPNQENEKSEIIVVEEPVADLKDDVKPTEESQENVSEDIRPADIVLTETVPQELDTQKEENQGEIVEDIAEIENKTVLDSETTVLMHKTVEEITLTAEQLVQEVLEQAEELVKQQDDAYPELPDFDPATQKLVDGIVVERFEQAAPKPVEAATDASSSQEAAAEAQEPTLQEQSVEELEIASATEPAVVEEDAGDMDSISEDTSLSVASVIEQQPKPKESDDSNTSADVLKTADAMTEITSSEVELVETKNLAVGRAMEETEAAIHEQVEVKETGNKSGAAVVDTVEPNVVIDQQPQAKESEDQATLPEALITTEVMTASTSSEPVFVELNDQPTVEAETVLEGTDTVDGAGNLFGAAAADSNDNKSVSIEEVLDEAAIVDDVEGKVIEEHIIPISIEKASASDTMTITEVTSDEAIVESPNVSKTTSNMPSPLITAVPLMDIIEEKQESAEPVPEALAEQETHSEISPAMLEHVTKEALVERTLNEAAAVVNEIESIVDHIITEKLIHSGASDALPTANGVHETSSQEPPRLAASAALIVEAIESQSQAGVHSMVPNSDSTQNMQTIAVTNELSTNLDETIGNTNLPATDSLPTVSPSLAPASTPSSEALPAPTTQSPYDVVPNGVSETQRIHFVADEQQTNVTAGQAASDVQGTTGSVEQRVAAPEAEHGSATSTIGQVPTSVSNVTNPKFLTLNLANYCTSDSSGNNSKSSSLSIANLSQSGTSLAGGDSADQLMELELLRKKLDETERAMTKIIANMGNIPKGQETNVNGDEPATEGNETATDVSATDGDDRAKVSNGHAIEPMENVAENTSSVQDTSGGESSSATSTPEKKPKKRDTSTERGTVKVMAMEVTAQRENGKRLSRPTTPLLPMSGHSDGATIAPTEEHETRSIVLDGRLPHDSKILVSDAETAVEKLEPENSEEEDDAPVILSGKMTLSLINMDFIEKDATGTVAVGEIVTELHKPQAEPTTTSPKDSE